MKPHSSTAPSRLVAHPSVALKGVIRAPGDKSISHRALLLAAMAQGRTEVNGLLESDDVLRTGRAIAALGASTERTGPGRWRITSHGRLTEPDDVIDCGNAGTGARLMLGVAAGYDLALTLTGDASLRGRPMGRVLEPLSEMGATWVGRDGGRLPGVLRGGRLEAIAWRLRQPSAQVKSAVILAGLNARGTTSVIEPAPTRDHTERMLRAFGAAVDVEEALEGRTIRIQGGQTLAGARLRVPGDPSSAAFPIVAATLIPGSAVTIEGLLLNPLRTGLLATLREMGADIAFSNLREEGGESVGDLTIRHAPLTGVVVPPERAASMIDEYPVLAVAAAFATGETVMRGVGELRVKESDRLAAMVGTLRACGVEAVEEPEGLMVIGSGGGVPGGAEVATLGDHRIAMAGLVLGLAARAPVTVDEAGMIATSFPGFAGLMAGLGADVRTA